MCVFKGKCVVDVGTRSPGPRSMRGPCVSVLSGLPGRRPDCGDGARWLEFGDAGLRLERYLHAEKDGVPFGRVEFPHTGNAWLRSSHERAAKAHAHLSEWEIHTPKRYSIFFGV